MLERGGSFRRVDGTLELVPSSLLPIAFAHLADIAAGEVAALWRGGFFARTPCLYGGT